MSASTFVPCPRCDGSGQCPTFRSDDYVESYELVDHRSHAQDCPECGGTGRASCEFCGAYLTASELFASGETLQCDACRTVSLAPCDDGRTAAPARLADDLRASAIARDLALVSDVVRAGGRAVDALAALAARRVS